MFTPIDSNESGQALTLADIFGVLKRRWWLFIPPTLIAVVVISVLTVRSTPLYRAEAEVVFRTEETANLFPLSDVGSLLRSPSAEEGFLASTEYQQQAKSSAGSDHVVSVDIGDVSSRVEPSFIGFTAVATAPDTAATIAQAWADTYISMRHERDAGEITQTIQTLETSIDLLADEQAVVLESLAPIDRLLAIATDASEVTQLTTQRLALLQALDSELAPIESEMTLVNSELANLRLIESFLVDEQVSARINRVATAPSSPFAPSLPKNLLFAIALGMLLGAAAAFFAESTDDRVRSSSDIERGLGLKALAAVHHQRRDDGSVHAAEYGQVAEAFQRLASAVDFATLDGHRSQVLMLTSGRSSEAKTTTTARLGVTLARQGRRTLLIGADLRRPTLVRRFGDHTGPGLGEVLSGLYDVRDCIRQDTGYANLELLPAGNIPDGRSPAELLRGSDIQALIDDLRGDYDHILLDCPPILPVVDALVVADFADGIILNTFASRSKLKDISRTLTLIRQATTAPVLGFVLTGANSKAEGYSNDNQYYSRPPIRLDNRKNRPAEPVHAVLTAPAVDLTNAGSALVSGTPSSNDVPQLLPGRADAPTPPHEIDFSTAEAQRRAAALAVKERIKNNSSHRAKEPTKATNPETEDIEKVALASAKLGKSASSSPNNKSKKTRKARKARK